MDYERDQALRSQLGPNEKLLWSGQPRGGIRLRPSDALLIPFSLMWGGFAIFWEYSVLTTGAPGFFGLWGIPFVLVGLYLIAGRFFYDAWARDHTSYGITDQRVLIVSGGFHRSIKSLSLRTLSEVASNERSDGSGTITFGPSLGLYGWLAGSDWPMWGRNTQPAFEMIENVRAVEGTLRDAQSRATSVGA